MTFEIILQTTPDVIREIGVTELVSLLLTAALVFLYWRMQRFQEIIASVQQKQTELMEEQAELMAINHQPVIELNYLEAAYDELNISLLNSGNGPARNLRVQCVVYKQMNEAELGQEMELQRGYIGEGPVLGPQWSHLMRRSALPLLEGSEFDGLTDGIEVDEGPVEFMGELYFKYRIPNKSHRFNFHEAVERMNQDWDSDFIALDFHLAYVNLAQKVYSTSLVAIANIPLEKGLTLEDALEKGEMTAPLGEPISEDEIGSIVTIDFEEMEIG